MATAGVQSEVAQFYANKNVLLTGGSGFLGKIIIQKLLRSCPDLGKIFLILREKKGKNAQERTVDILNNMIFDSLKNEVPDYREKIHPICGNIHYIGYSLQDSDRQLLIDETDIVIHSAATVRFDEKLSIAVNTNIKGTRELLKICEEMKKLIAVMYISTAYSFCPRRRIGEYFMEPPIQADTILKLVEDTKDEVLDEMTPTLIGDWPNTYTYTKAITEDLVKSKKDILPIGMFRPSIVIPTYKDPLTCWTDNLNSVTGVGLGAGLGVVHTFYCDKKVKPDFVPGDYCVNGLLAAIVNLARQYAKETSPEKIIYNYVAKYKNSISLEQFGIYAQKYYIPFSDTIWIIWCHLTTCPVLFWTLTICLHYIPAVLMDSFSILQGKKPRYFKACNRITGFNRVLTYFMVQEWSHSDDNMLQVWNELSAADKEMYPFNMDNLDWDDYYKNFAFGIKSYLLKDKMDKESIEIAEKRYKRFQTAHHVLKGVLLFISAFILWKIFNEVCSYF